MDDCPYCDKWRYDPTGAPVVARQVGQWAPLVHRQGQIRRINGSDAPNGLWLARAAHICEQHPLEPEVLLLGPVRLGSI